MAEWAESQGMHWFLASSGAGLFLVNTVGFVTVSRTTRTYSVDELWGDSISARHTILPAWRPLLVALCFALAVATVAEVTAVIVVAATAERLGRTTAWAWYDVSCLAFLSLDGLVPSILTQPSVSLDSFRRSATFGLAQFVVSVMLLGVSLIFAGDRIVRLVAGGAMVASAGLLPGFFFLGLLTGAFRSRVRLHSRTHTAAFVLFVWADLSWMVSFASRRIALERWAPVDQTSVVSIVAVVLMLFLQSLLPLATWKTLVADTKFWRGLGRYNANARFGGAGLRSSELCVQRSSGNLAEMVATAERNRTLTTLSRTSPVTSSTTRKRPEMGLEVASAKLQHMIERAYRDRRMLEFEYLTIEPKVIGRGTTAFVYRGSFKNEEVAVKVFNPSEITDEYVEAFGKELHLMAQLHHRNVLMLYGLCVRPPSICAVFELCAAGSLATAIKAAVSAGKWNTEARLRVAFDCASSIAYLHAVGVWHRDVKLENFLVASDGTVKLCDFGESIRRSTAISRGQSSASAPPNVSFASADTPTDASPRGSKHRRHDPTTQLALAADDRKVASPAVPGLLARKPGRSPKVREMEPEDDSAMLDIVGTVAYMAPELIAAKRDDYTEAVDVFALGVVLRCVWTAQADPWPRHLQTFEIFAAVERGDRPPLGHDCPATFAAIVTNAWAQDPVARPDAATLRDLVIKALDLLCGPQAIPSLIQHIQNAPGLKNPRQQRSGPGASIVDRLFFSKPKPPAAPDDEGSPTVVVPGGCVASSNADHAASENTDAALKIDDLVSDDDDDGSTPPRCSALASLCPSLLRLRPRPAPSIDDASDDLQIHPEPPVLHDARVDPEDIKVDHPPPPPPV